MAVTLKIQGLKELQAAMREMGRQPARRIADAGLRAGARVVVDLARAKAPRGTAQLPPGVRKRLHQSIGARPSRRLTTGTVRSFIIGIERPRSRIAHLLEFGTRYMPARPYLRPALDEGAQRALQAMAEKMRERLEIEAQRLNPKGR